MFVRSLLSFLLMPAFVLAHLVCACGMGPAQPRATQPAPSHQAAKHDCCKGEDGHEDAPQSGDHHDHKSPCQCSEADGKLAVVEQAKAPAAHLALLPSFLFPAAVYTLPDLSPVRLQSFTPWLSDLSPPPDLLRVKCTLQI